MKKLSLLTLSLLAMISCGSGEKSLTIYNDLAIDRLGELIEIEIENADQYVVCTPEGKALETQTTHEGNLIFVASVEASSSSKYLLRKGERPAIDTVAVGRVFTERKSDIAWESDKIGYRAYSKVAGENGDKLYGMDIFTKRSSSPVLEMLYSTVTDPEYKKIRAEISKKDPTAAATLRDALTFHLDHGLGMDYYAVGATLGAGTAALLEEGEIRYPLYYDKCEILDKGGLRFKFRLTYDPVTINGQQIVEVRTITLDAGSHFNNIEVEYRNLSEPNDVAIGIVLHDQGDDMAQGEGYIAYAEPTHQYGWQTYNAIIYPTTMEYEKDLLEQPEGIVYGHLLAKGSYTPNEPLNYYMGAAWNRWGFASATEWFKFVEQQKARYDSPLRYEIR